MTASSRRCLTAMVGALLAGSALVLSPPTPVGAGSPGSLVSWGLNDHGQLGDNTIINKTSPVAVSGGLTNITRITGGWKSSLALASDGTVWSWGTNAQGQLGDNTTVDKHTPVQVSGLTGITAIAAGGFHGLARKSDGTVWAWGLNNYGQLGDNTIVDKHTPFQVSGLTGITAIAAGWAHSMALKSDGTVWAWGLNNYGQVGDNTTVDKHTPVQVSGLTGVTAISAGYDAVPVNEGHSMALKSDGTVWAWGYNAQGQLGDNTIVEKHTPVQVSGLTGITAIAAGGFHNLARKSDGTVWAWGLNNYGQLGDGTTVDKHTPVQVSGLTGVRGISAGWAHSIALKSDGTVWGWGYNIDGELGDTTTTWRAAPVQVTGLTGVITIGTGLYHTFAVEAALPQVTSISPVNGPEAGGTTVVITGSGFTGATSVKFGVVAGAGLTVNSDTQITVVDPAGAATVDVVVTALGGTSAPSTADWFSYATLSIAAPSALTLPALIDGSSTAATPIGTLKWTNTLNDATSWTVTFAATDLYFGSSPGQFISFTHFTIAVDQSLTGTMTSGPAVSAGTTPQTLAGADATPGTTYSTPITLATGSATTEGTWTMANNLITVDVPADTRLSTTFVATLQYTITG